MAKSFAVAAAVLAVFAISLLPAGWSEGPCPSGYYPDPDASNCKLGVPYSLSVAHQYGAPGKMSFMIRVENVASWATVGISSSSDYVTPIFYYSDGGKVQLGDYMREGSSSSAPLGSCASYSLGPGESVIFTTNVSFKPNQDGRGMTASADNMNWAVLSSGCAIVAQGRATKVGTDSFAYTYNSVPVPSQCAGEGQYCGECCPGLSCQGGVCAAAAGPSEEISAPEAGGKPAGGISMGLILGSLVGLVVVGGIAFFVLNSRQKQHRHKRK